MLYNKLNINRYGSLAAILFILLFANLSYSQKIRVLTLNEALSLAERNNSDLMLAKMGKMQAIIVQVLIVISNYTQSWNWWSLWCKTSIQFMFYRKLWMLASVMVELNTSNGIIPQLSVVIKLMSTLWIGTWSYLHRVSRLSKKNHWLYLHTMES